MLCVGCGVVCYWFVVVIEWYGCRVSMTSDTRPLIFMADVCVW